MSDSPQGKIHDAAMIAHEANRAYCLTIGDSSQPDWKSAPNWQRDSAIAGALAIWNNPSMTPEQSHESWSAQKLADGWVYGPVKDAEAKTHPCLVPYSELPIEQQVKDALFGAVVRAVLVLPQLSGGVALDDHDAIVDTLTAENHQLRDHITQLRAELSSWVDATPATQASSTAAAPSNTEPTEAEGAEA